jgi:hypothetical protein
MGAERPPLEKYMTKASIYEDLKTEAAKIADKRETIKALIEKIENNFLPISFESEVWLDKKFYENNQGGLQSQYFLGYMPSGNPGTIVAKTIVRDSIKQDIMESKIVKLSTIENSLILGTAAKWLFELITEVRNHIQRHKDALLTVNMEPLEQLASSDFGTDLP